ncbi:hypothetical protein [Micromonospora sp. HM5-17]|uniref:hypothetical protein n=1 Tax=Micromonospora sp. HM5-17 TaxID=2487710 RepID=UPI000F48C520|nr:hypothetical protein [Micromonospora sp. HM5-17]ROT32304.1 hypothetical protein EF879_12070 [Micromonospora sp. HM5-17]
MVVTEVWALLMVGALVLLALVGLAVLADRPRTPRPDPVRLRAAAAELTAHAVRIRTEAGRAAAVASDARAALLAAEHTRDEAWAAQEEAERHYDQVRRAVAAARAAARRANAPVTVPVDGPGPATVHGPAPAAREAGAPASLAAQPGRHHGTVPGYAAAPPVVAAASVGGAERDRVVSRAALSAYRRGDISLAQLREVFRRIGDWDPLREERERQLDQARIRLMAARREYDRAAVAARRAARAAWVAEVAVRALLEEAEQSAVEADEAIQMAQRYSRRRDRRPRAPRRGRGRRTGGRERPHR